MKHENTMSLYDELSETLLSLSGILHGLEAVAGLPSVRVEQGVSLAALGGSLVDDARVQAERLYRAIQENENNGGGTPKRQQPGKSKTTDVIPLQLKTKEKEG